MANCSELRQRIAAALAAQPRLQGTHHCSPAAPTSCCSDLNCSQASVACFKYPVWQGRPEIPAGRCLGCMCTEHAHSCLPAGWWLEALAAFTTATEAACRSVACPPAWAPLSTQHCWRAFWSAADMQKTCSPAYMVSTLVGLSRFHLDLHERLLASDAAAAQRTEFAAVAAARCCLRVARAAESWQGERATNLQKYASTHAMQALLEHLQALHVSPAFSCQAAYSQRGQHVTGKRAVAAVTEVAQLVAEALRTVVGVPPLCGVRVPGFLQGGASLPAVVCVSVISIGCHSLVQELPGRQVQLTSCADGEQVLPMAKALLSLLRAQVRHAAWPRWHTSRHGT